MIDESTLKPVLIRVAPGDRWAKIHNSGDEQLNGFDCSDEDVIADNLTDALGHIFKDTGNRRFFVDAEKGLVYIEDSKIAGFKRHVYEEVGLYK